MSVLSPCISVCLHDPVTDYCYGCGRTRAEIQIWKSPQTDQEWKAKNLEVIKARLSGFQHEAFERSYAYKKKHGVSPIKELKLKGEYK